jgi:hypothetical protein
MWVWQITTRIASNASLCFDIIKKIEVAEAYKRLRTEAILKGRSRPKIAEVARMTGVSTFYVRKVESEILLDGDVVDPKLAEPSRAIGPGALTFERIGEFVLLLLYQQQPHRAAVSQAIVRI